MAYSFAIATSGKAKRILLAGFDGYEGEDPRNFEMNNIVKIYIQTPNSTPLLSILPTRYDVDKQSIYGEIR